MKKIIFLIVLAALVLIVATRATDFRPESMSGDQLASYFQSQMIAEGVEEVGQPIEGFDEAMLRMAFSGLKPTDFSKVKTIEGQYEVEGNTISFLRNDQMNITSAERMVSAEGYVTLLENVAKRMNLRITTKADVDNLLRNLD